MIIFSLEALADDSHRRHFLTPKKDDEVIWINKCAKHKGYWKDWNTKKPWKPDYEAYNAACGEDKPVKAVLDLAVDLLSNDIDREYGDIVIWSTICKTQRHVLLEWIAYHLEIFGFDPEFYDKLLKMRPEGDTTPAHEIKEKWYDLHNVENPRDSIEYVFESDPESVAMWKRRGIFVFDCNQEE